jgi:hypothetical protein
MGALAADDDAGAVRVAGVVDQAPQLGNLGACAQGSVLFQCRVPDPVGQAPDGFADLVGDGVSDGETGVDPALPQVAQVGEEGFRAACAVGADEDFGAVAVGVGDLGESLVEDGDVVGCGVRSGIARSQDRGEGLAGVVQEAEQRVVAEAAFVGGGGLFLLGVAGDQGRVDVQDQTRQFTSSGVGCGYGMSGLIGLQPGGLTGLSPGCPQRVQGCLVGRPARARQSGWRRRGRTRRAGRAARPGRRSLRRRRRASPPGPPRRGRDRDRSRGRSRCRASLKALVSEVASARSARRREPTWLTTPFPSALTTSLGRDRIVGTQKVPSYWNAWDLSGRLRSGGLPGHRVRPTLLSILVASSPPFFFLRHSLSDSGTSSSEPRLRSKIGRASGRERV